MPMLPKMYKFHLTIDHDNIETLQAATYWPRPWLKEMQPLMENSNPIQHQEGLVKTVNKHQI